MHAQLLTRLASNEPYQFGLLSKKTKSCLRNDLLCTKRDIELCLVSRSFSTNMWTNKTERRQDVQQTTWDSQRQVDTKSQRHMDTDTRSMDTQTWGQTDTQNKGPIFEKSYDEVMQNLWQTYDDITGILWKRKIRGKWCHSGNPLTEAVIGGILWAQITDNQSDDFLRMLSKNDLSFS